MDLGINSDENIDRGHLFGLVPVVNFHTVCSLLVKTTTARGNALGLSMKKALKEKI